MTKHTPATPLPFKTQDERLLVESRGFGISGSEIIAHIRSPGRPPYGITFESHQESCIQDARYIAHAANAYPKLVEMLRNIAANEWDATGATPTGKSVSALLRELGEVE